MYRFSTRSEKILATCDIRLQKILREAIYYRDFSVVCGHRDRNEQTSLYKRGLTQLQYPNSKHNNRPSLAVDVVPWVHEYGALYGDVHQVIALSKAQNISKRRALKKLTFMFGLVIGTIEQIAANQNIYVRCGYSWNGSRNALTNQFDDLGHIELII